MPAILRKQRIPNGQTSVYAERWRQGKGKVGYIRPSIYATSPAWVWSVIDMAGTPHEHASHFRQGAHAVAWLLTITKKGDHLDQQTWEAINKAAPDQVQAFRDKTGQDWKPDIEQAQLF